MIADALIEVRLKTTSEGGRNSPIKGPIYGCPLLIGGEGFDCRLFINEQVLELGKIYQISVKFLNPTLALPKLAIEKQISLWEGKEIAIGRIVGLKHDIEER